MYGPWGWCGAGMMLVWLVFLVLIIVGVVLVVRSLSGGGISGRSGGSRALDILDERFARGELEQKDYEERQRLLRGRS